MLITYDDVVRTEVEPCSLRAGVATAIKGASTVSAGSDIRMMWPTVVRRTQRSVLLKIVKYADFR